MIDLPKTDIRALLAQGAVVWGPDGTPTPPFLLERLEESLHYFELFQPILNDNGKKEKEDVHRNQATR